MEAAIPPKRRTQIVDYMLSQFQTVVYSSLSQKVKVKCTLLQALRLCTGRTAHRRSRGIALLFHDHGTRRGEGSASRPGSSLPQGKTRYPLYRRLGGPQGRSGQVRKISPPTGIRSPDRPARSQSLYRLSYPAHALTKVRLKTSGWRSSVTKICLLLQSCSTENAFIYASRGTGCFCRAVSRVSFVLYYSLSCQLDICQIVVSPYNYEI